MRARLDRMAAGQHFVFLCLPIMAERMDTLVPENGGEIIEWDARNYGVVITIRKGDQS